MTNGTNDERDRLRISAKVSEPFPEPGEPCARPDLTRPACASCSTDEIPAGEHFIQYDIGDPENPEAFCARCVCRMIGMLRAIGDFPALGARCEFDDGSVKHVAWPVTTEWLDFPHLDPDSSKAIHMDELDLMARNLVLERAQDPDPDQHLTFFEAVSEVLRPQFGLRRLTRCADGVYRETPPGGGQGLGLAEESRWLTCDQVIEVVAAFYGHTVPELATRSRRSDVLKPRQIAMYLCRQHTDAPASQIAAAFNRQHTAVANAVEMVASRIGVTGTVAAEVEALSKKLDRMNGKGSVANTSKETPDAVE